MNITIRLPRELENKIGEKANEKLIEVIDDILKNDTEIDQLVRTSIKSQIKSVALQIMQSPDLRSRMAQRVYPIIYEIIGLDERKD